MSCGGKVGEPVGLSRTSSLEVGVEEPDVLCGGDVHRLLYASGSYGHDRGREPAVGDEAGGSPTPVQVIVGASGASAVTGEEHRIEVDGRSGGVYHRAVSLVVDESDRTHPNLSGSTGDVQANRALLNNPASDLDVLRGSVGVRFDGHVGRSGLRTEGIEVHDERSSTVAYHPESHTGSAGGGVHPGEAVLKQDVPRVLDADTVEVGRSSGVDTQEPGEQVGDFEVGCGSGVV